MKKAGGGFRKIKIPVLLLFPGRRGKENIKENLTSFSEWNQKHSDGH